MLKKGDTIYFIGKHRAFTGIIITVIMHPDWYPESGVKKYGVLHQNDESKHTEIYADESYKTLELAEEAALENIHTSPKYHKGKIDYLNAILAEKEPDNDAP